MGAAAWTYDAEDITEGGSAVWRRYLSVQELSDRIDLAPATIMDTLTRRPLPDDPRFAIYRPAARIGQTRVAAVPMWAPEQSEHYRKLAKARGVTLVKTRRAKTVNGPNKLPVYNVAEAAEEGLASTDELAEITGFAENTLRRFDRENADFPVEVGVAERVAPKQYGPPRTLRRIADVEQWIATHRHVVGRGQGDATAGDLADDLQPVGTPTA